MNLDSSDKYEIAKAAFTAGANFAEVALGDALTQEEIDDAFSDWLDHLSE